LQDPRPTIQVDGVDSRIFAILIDFIYTGKLMVDLDNVEAVVAASSLLHLASIVDLCSKFKQANQSTETNGWCAKEQKDFSG